MVVGVLSKLARTVRFFNLSTLIVACKLFNK